MMGTKWVGGVCLAYMARAYVRVALPKETVRSLAQPGTAYGIAGAVVCATGLILADGHVAPSARSRAWLACRSRPSLASIGPAIAGLFMLVTWWQLPKSTVIPVAEAATVIVAASPSGASLGIERQWVARDASEQKPLPVDFWGKLVRSLQRARGEDVPRSSRARVRVEGARYVARHVDATNDDDPSVARVRERYGAAAALPVSLLFDSHGDKALGFTEFVAPQRLAAALASVRRLWRDRPGASRIRGLGQPSRRRPRGGCLAGRVLRAA